MILACVFGCGLLAFALKGHPIELHDSAELDDYVGSAQKILSGSLPRDPFRPLLYPLLVAGAALLTGADCFLAARIVSVLAAAGIVLATYGLGRALADDDTGLLAALIVGVNGSWWTLGVQAATDVTFTLTLLLTLLAALRALRDPRWSAAMLCGLSLAVSYFTRYTAVVLLLPVLPAVWCGARAGERWTRIGWMALGLCAGLLPHALLTWSAYGSPFYDESWRSLAFRHFGQGDWGFLQSNPFDGTSSVLLHDPSLLLRNIGDTLRDMLRHGLWRLLVDAPQAVALAPLVLFGAYLWTRRRPKEGLLVAGALVGYLGLICATFFAWERILFPVLPLLAVALASAVMHVTRILVGGLSSTFLARLSNGAAVVALVAALALPLPDRLSDFRALHPLDELAAAKELMSRHSPDTLLLSSYGLMNRHVPTLILPSSAGVSVAAFQRETLALLAKHDVDYVVVGRLSLGASTFRDLGRNPMLRDLQLEHADPDVRIYRVEPAALEEVAAPPRVTESRAGVFVIELEWLNGLPPGVPVRVRLRGPRGESRDVQMQPVEGRPASSLTLDLTQAPGTWSLQIRTTHPDGIVRASKPLSITYEGP